MDTFKQNGSLFQRAEKPYAAPNGLVLVKLEQSYRRNNKGDIAGFKPEVARVLTATNPGPAFGFYVAPAAEAEPATAEPARRTRT